jgi:hypothetical protein
VNNKSAAIDDWVNVIYPMQGNFYTASFKSSRNNHIESYYEIISLNDNVTTILNGKRKIIFN